MFLEVLMIIIIILLKNLSYFSTTCRLTLIISLLLLLKHFSFHFNLIFLFLLGLAFGSATGGGGASHTSFNTLPSNPQIPSHLHQEQDGMLYTQQQQQQQQQQGLSDLGGFLSSSRDVKPGATGIGHSALYNDLGWLNVEGGVANMSHGFMHDLQTGGGVGVGGGGLGSFQHYEHFQLGLEDSTGVAMKSSNGSINALTMSTEMQHPFLESGHCGSSGLYGQDTTLLNLDLTS